MTIKSRDLLLGFAGLLLLILLAAAKRPGLVLNPKYLGSILFGEAVIFCLWRYCNRFYTALILTFMWAGGAFPMSNVASTLRWIVLATAAGAGLFVWVRSDRQSLGPFHLAALASIVTALASSLMSSTPLISVLKVASLAMLFTYGATGARASFRYDREKFLATVLTGCELIAFISAFVYLILKIPMFGNPNSLGAVMAMIAPLLLWDVLVNPGKKGRSRRLAALCLCGLLLYTSVARAAILGAAAATIVLCTILRRHRMLAQIALVSVLLISLAGVLEPARFSNVVGSVTGNFLYKNNEQSGVLGSRLNPWAKASETIKKHPLLGSGFGTRAWLSVGDVSQLQLSRSQHDFEYGSSYVSIVDYTGVVGASAFGILLIFLFHRIFQVSRFVWRTRRFTYQAIPFMLIVIVGIVHAGFEDWMFAAGSYICVFFWPCAFLLMDMVPLAAQPAVSNPSLRRPVGVHPGFAAIQHRGL